jgi:lipoyl(octanoyl) transferase
VAAERRAGAPGAYVADHKIASLGLRVRAGRSYHGLAFNARMDLAPFHAIEPCGYPGLSMTQLAKWRPDIDSAEAGERLLRQLLPLMGYTESSATVGSPGSARPFDARR